MKWFIFNLLLLAAATTAAHTAPSWEDGHPLYAAGAVVAADDTVAVAIGGVAAVDTAIQGASGVATAADTAQSPAATTNNAPDSTGMDSDTRYDRRIRRYRRHWAALIPTHTVVQYAGNMGLVSAGIGWEYGKRRQWETELLFGFLPKYNSSRAKMTMTLKENFVPWHLEFHRGFLLSPLSCGLYVNIVYGSEFWSRQPGRYPDKYYNFLSTKLRINAFVGQRIGVVIPHNRRKYVKSVTFFYELSTCDLYVRALFMDKDVKPTDITSLSLGLRLQLF